MNGDECRELIGFLDKVDLVLSIKIDSKHGKCFAIMLTLYYATRLHSNKPIALRAQQQ